jgi:hypothetical protein
MSAPIASEPVVLVREAAHPSQVLDIHAVTDRASQTVVGRFVARRL